MHYQFNLSFEEFVDFINRSEYSDTWKYPWLVLHPLSDEHTPPVYVICESLKIITDGVIIKPVNEKDILPILYKLKAVGDTTLIGLPPLI
jgi:hypothetical protein